MYSFPTYSVSPDAMIHQNCSYIFYLIHWTVKKISYIISSTSLLSLCRWLCAQWRLENLVVWHFRHMRKIIRRHWKHIPSRHHWNLLRRKNLTYIVNQLKSYFCFKIFLKSNYSIMKYFYWQCYFVEFKFWVVLVANYFLNISIFIFICNATL